MNKWGCLWFLLIALVFAVLGTLLGCFYAVYQTEQVIITQFGKPVGEPIEEPGLHFKLPIIQEDILGSETRNAVAKHDLIEIVRTDKERKPLRDENLKNAPIGLGTIGVLPPIQYGRVKIEEEIKTKGAKKLAEFGIDLLDVRLKRVNYNPDVLGRIYQRMISERSQIAQRFRSEGEGEAARIAGQKERDLNEIQSTAYRQVQQIRGEADAKATEIYAQAYTQNPHAADFYNFLKSMETYRKVLTKDATLVLSTDSDLFNLLKRAGTKPSNAPPAR